MPQIVNIAIISTHAPAGGATIIAECEEQGIQFLLTPLREGRRHDQTFELASSNFYSRPCGRGDECELKELLKNKISTHAPAGGATAGARRRRYPGPISTHAPAGGAIAEADRRPHRPQISTHAPAGGATRGHRGDGRGRPISTHAPAGGATLFAQGVDGSWNISTHAPAGGATRGAQPNGRAGVISTHAPAGGATIHPVFSANRIRNFYSRPCGRGDSNFPQVRHEVLRQIAER